MKVDDKVLKNIQKILNDTISNLLYGGGGEAGNSELLSAANAYKVLKLLNLRVKNENDIFKELSGENVHNYNYIESRSARDNDL